VETEVLLSSDKIIHRPICIHSK